jgi:dTMP kinase
VLAQLERWVQQGRQPDLTLWFDLPAAVAAERRAAVRAPDRFESQDLAFFERVRAGYLARSQLHDQRFRQLDALGSRDAVWAQVRSALSGTGWW